MAAVVGLGAIAENSRASGGRNDECRQLRRHRARGDEVEVRVAVTDQRGNPVNEAHVVLRKQKTEEGVTLIADENGRVVFGNVDRGRYDLDVMASGFMPIHVIDLKVRYKESIEIRIDLQGAALGEILPFDARELEKCSE